ncbi:recombinase family protein [Stieleria sedimenti]|uniref:recombinase family protein n=1 Tax=Stieleria sedimenti TaxID=2976331 RepID=UPI00389A4533
MGGNLERPAMKRLMADIEAGKIDCVVVYKIDRLSRSLLDFSRVMETFERHNVAFVSVTQQFNTASSMGRLILNVLLSFAQFEREMISERTRDKIAATRRKGKWCGGVPVFGFTIEETKLVVVPHEAERVRQIFDLYRRTHSLLETAKAEAGCFALVSGSWSLRRQMTK